ncbi:phosphoglycerate dehydrogenase [Vallitalea okinawensis]|uniref:phosphoglycerate dehydrogenase n=1 Tax=Vallitalea okinawensis TaxID=2078660 RepID=UPI000CFB611B|nr:phosphoglycerate dehydrogenase [Vallitalea okinawensis]
MYYIKTLNKISEKGLTLFNQQYEIDGDTENVDAYLVRSTKMHDMELNRNTLAIARAGAGVNNIPLDKCSEEGIVVFNTPGANANAVKELVLTGLLLASRKVVDGITWVEEIKDQEESIPGLVEKKKSAFAGPEIMGKKLGVVGLGAIGVMVANAASSLGMEVRGFDPFISVQSAWGLSRSIIRCNELDELLSECDYITIHVPLLNDTKHMFDREKFSKMKAGVRILNFSRAALVKDEDIITAINDGKVSCYVTDFPNEKVLGKDGVISIPHLGASTPESEENCAVMAVNELTDYLENGNITNSVNYPSCSLGKRKSLCRLTIHHKNQPAMVGKITNVLADLNVNIADMNNRSKGTYAYTAMDLDTSVDDSIADKLRQIEGIIKVRLIV